MALHRLPAIGRLRLAALTSPATHPMAGRPILVYGYLIHHPEGPILVDTGVGEGNEAIDRLYAPLRRPLEACLAEDGVALGDIVAVVNSHLHFDHCGNNRLFQGTPIHVQRAEYEAAETPRYTVPEWVDFPGAAFRLADGETEIADGIRLLPTPGHTPGHQSVVIEADEGRAILCCQAIYDASSLWARDAALNAAEGLEAAYEASRTRLRALGPARLYFSHDRDLSWIT